VRDGKKLKISQRQVVKRSLTKHHGLMNTYYIRVLLNIKKQPINVPSAGAQTFLMDYT
jgi:hypothetical protein